MQSPSCNVPVVGDDTGIGDQMRGPDLSVIPDRCGAVVVAPEDVALAVAVEVAGFGKMPAVGDGAGVGDHVSPAFLPVIPDRGRAVALAPGHVALALSG